MYKSLIFTAKPSEDLYKSIQEYVKNLEQFVQIKNVCVVYNEEEFCGLPVTIIKLEK